MAEIDGRIVNTFMPGDFFGEVSFIATASSILEVVCLYNFCEETGELVVSHQESTCSRLPQGGMKRRERRRGGEAPSVRAALEGKQLEGGS